MIKILKSGYTTGTCSAIAAKAAAKMIFLNTVVESEFIITPSGKRIEVPIYSARLENGLAECAVKKDAGDDPDITNGMLVFVSVTLCGDDIVIDGGKGVGRVTKPGLNQPVGNAAINSVPREMIKAAVQAVLEENGCESGARVIISIPDGERLAKKTFNPRLGIEGGLSILGTSGIVEPMSTKALIDTIETELNFKKGNGYNYAFIVPGNYGRDFAYEKWGIDIDAAVKCSNYIGDAIDLAAEKGFCGMVLIGHIGKLAKLAAGIMNTHSREADGRAEVFCTNAALCGAERECTERLFNSVTTDEMVKILDEYGIRKEVMKKIGNRIDFYINKRCGGRIKYAFAVFSNVYGLLCSGGDEEIFLSAVEEFK